MNTISPSTGASGTITHRMLGLGIAAGPWYVLVGLVQILTREGFDVRKHALSLLSNGEFGWVQTLNFFVTGASVIAGAFGCRRAMRGQSAGTWGPLLLSVFGVGMFGAGFFPADPSQDFPPGAAPTTELSQAGVLHFVCGAIAFYAMIAACFVFTRRFVRLRKRGWALYSALTGVGFFASFAAIASGSTAPSVMILFYIAVAWILAWHTAVLIHVAQEVKRRHISVP